jgi:hypothetical protein
VHNCGYKFLKRICIIHILWTGQKYHNWPPPGFGWLGLLVLVPVNRTRTELEPCLKSDPILKPLSKMDLVLELEPEFLEMKFSGKIKTLELEVNQQLITGLKLDYLKLELDLISRTGTRTGT